MRLALITVWKKLALTEKKKRHEAEMEMAEENMLIVSLAMSTYAYF